MRADLPALPCCLGSTSVSLCRWEEHTQGRMVAQSCWSPSGPQLGAGVHPQTMQLLPSVSLFSFSPVPVSHWAQCDVLFCRHFDSSFGRKITQTQNNGSKALAALQKRAFAACLHRGRSLNSGFPGEQLGLRFPSPPLFFSLLSPN